MVLRGRTGNLSSNVQRLDDCGLDVLNRRRRIPLALERARLHDDDSELTEQRYHNSYKLTEIIVQHKARSTTTKKETRGLRCGHMRK